MYQTLLEQLTAFATGEAFQAQVLAAKADYFAATGEVFEDDRSFEQRMASFLEYYLFDRVLAERGQTPAQLYLAEKGAGLAEAERVDVEAFGRTLHSLFEVRKLVQAGVRVRDLFTGRDYEVFERRTKAGMGAGDLLEARLIPSEGKLLFSQAFCYHPRQARAAIVKEIRKNQKQPGPDYSPRQLMSALSRMALKVERYRNIAVEAIYTFDKKTI